ncbi:hypothetical protein [uncultured Pseudacidovorax sp.]|uniref:hypothetical protein n=1 Tax=uncultured Pseudacidovorax sp. TaxID=679313 RepID=UPI0025E796F5|nr:hypothetical protein [uncultured Pseudacidovorax sp.]
MNTTTDVATAQDQLARLADLLAATRRDPLQLGRLCDHARQASALQAVLPPRYAPVLLDVVDRLESSALFSEESCSFSQKDLLDSLQLWADKAQGVLAEGVPARSDR